MPLVADGRDLFGNIQAAFISAIYEQNPPPITQNRGQIALWDVRRT